MTQRYIARFANSAQDVVAAQALRSKVFLADPNGLDHDSFDDQCLHVLIEDMRKENRLVCVFRIQPFKNGAEIDSSYSAQFYDLSNLHHFSGKLIELGRFCIDPAYIDPDILRVAWGVMTTYVDGNNVEMLFGCTSFSGTTADTYIDAFALLKERHLAPNRWLPRIKAPAVFNFAHKLALMKPDVRAAQKKMPPLLRTYLAMGGWVSDHAVVDEGLDTMHVFTGLEISTIPQARKRLLRAAAIQA